MCYLIFNVVGTIAVIVLDELMTLLFDAFVLWED